MTEVNPCGTVRIAKQDEVDKVTDGLEMEYSRIVHWLKKPLGLYLILCKRTIGVKLPDCLETQ